tara:strand:- start:1297 stop:1533 length:237 start_codon:yes stop_codon:yes gene_type:complete
MNYYEQLCAEQGLQARTVLKLVEEVFQDPTDSRLRVLGAVLAAARAMVPDGGGWAERLHDLLVIVGVERAWLHEHETA